MPLHWPDLALISEGRRWQIGISLLQGLKRGVHLINIGVTAPGVAFGESVGYKKHMNSSRARSPPLQTPPKQISQGSNKSLLGRILGDCSHCHPQGLGLVFKVAQGGAGGSP